MIRADLHMHTRASDGACPPEEMARKVKQAGVQLFAVTDHDNMEGVELAERAAKEEGLLFVRGIEISAYNECGKVHVLGYCCNKNAVYGQFLKERIEGSYVRAQDILEKANAYFGTSLTLEDAEQFHAHKNSPIHTMHIVNAFMKRLKRDRLELYREAFSFGGPAYSDLCRPSPEDAIQYIHGMGGIASLAHPAQIHTDPAMLTAIMDGLKDAGLDGIECFHSTHTERESASFLQYATEHKLLVTGGSDFHADGTDRELGIPEFYASDALLKALGL